MSVERVIPVIGVADVQRSRDFYVEVLGFDVLWGFGEGSIIGAVAANDQQLMLSQWEARGETVWIGVEDILPYHERLVRAGAKILQPPTNQTYAHDFRAEDPDGNILWFGSAPL